VSGQRIRSGGPGIRARLDRLAELWAGTGPERPAVPAAVLAALAEAGIIILPLKTVATQAMPLRSGPLVSYGGFVALFVIAVALAVAFRGWEHLQPAVGGLAVVVAIAQAALSSHRSLGGTIVVVVLAQLVALRVISMGLRDWRNPVQAEFGWGAGVLLVEILLARSVGSDWDSLLPVIAPVFFLGSLTSRAASVRLAGRVGVRSTADERRWALLSVALVGAAAAAMVLAWLAGGRGGALESLGHFIAPILLFVIGAVAWVVAQILRPIFWLVSKFHIDPDAFRRALDRLRGGRNNPVRAALDRPGSAQRLLGLVAIVAIGLVLAWAYSRNRRRGRQAIEAEEEAVVPSHRIRLPARRKARARRLRHELPADTVRRWYAETLLMLERRGFPRPGGLTPGEYLGRVNGAFPQCAPAFTALTRAYEDVRYGSRVFDSPVLDRIGIHRDVVMEALERAKEIDDRHQERSRDL
jgi:uncharacterized protein DUF4129